MSFPKRSSWKKNIKHNIEIIVDRLVVKEGIEKRLTDSLETVLNLAGGLALVDVQGGETLQFSQSFSCPDCGISIEEIEPRSFSFNNPFGACPDCYGLGYKMEFDVDLMIPDPTLSILDGAITVLAGSPVRRKEALPGRFWTPWRKRTILIWGLLLPSFRNRFAICSFMARTEEK